MAAQACTSTNSGVPARRRLRAAGKAVIATQHHGPRRCTDLFFLILFLGALGLLTSLTVDAACGRKPLCAVTIYLGHQ